ncbi:MAG: RpiB/LacA/LacB family sugar-phosphate isomerase [Bacilli bacterium]|nr:RpiB/LacA/LacB family sugar-phosphate isomerase [Bacilli bacterium]
MKIALASDHGGYDHKKAIKEYLLKNGHTVIDCGTNSTESCHYPIFAKKAAELFVNHQVERIILVCTTGEGIMMTVNRYKGIRCGVGYHDEVVKLMREHNDANAISFGAKFMPLADCLRRIDIFLTTPFLGGRHLTRVNMIDENH